MRRTRAAAAGAISSVRNRFKTTNKSGLASTAWERTAAVGDGVAFTIGQCRGADAPAGVQQHVSVVDVQERATAGDPKKSVTAVMRPSIRVIT